MVARENTLTSLAAAMDLGADWVEIDAKVTKDDVTIVVHDDNFARLWGLDLDVRRACWPDMQSCLGSGPDGVPTLTAAVELVASRHGVLMIDIADEHIASRCCALPAVNDNADAVVFTGDPDGLILVRRQLPDAVIAVSWERAVLPADALLDAIISNDIVALRGVLDHGCPVTT